MTALFSPEEKVDSSETLRVLVVDDNEPSAQTLGWMIEALGYDAKIALNGQAALEIALHYRPHLALLDIGLPGMTGYELCEKLKQLPELKSTVFIAQTGWARIEDLQKSRIAGFDHHLVKPVDFKTLEPILFSVSQNSRNKISALKGLLKCLKAQQ